jgi:hypothetical protein
MRRWLAIVLLGVIAPLAARAQSAASPAPTFDKRQFVVSSSVYWGGVAADYVSTEQALRRGFVERNPLLQGATRKAVYWGVAGGVYALTLWLEKKHPRAARVMRYIGGGIHFGAAAYNWSQEAGGRRQEAGSGKQEARFFQSKLRMPQSAIGQ